MGCKKMCGLMLEFEVSAKKGVSRRRGIRLDRQREWARSVKDESEGEEGGIIHFVVK